MNTGTKGNPGTIAVLHATATWCFNHAVECPCGTRSYRIGIAAGMLGGYGDGPIGTAHDGALVIKGIGGPEIEDKPVSFDELVKVTVVPVLMQKALLGLAPEILGVALAEDPALRRMSTEQGEEAEPQVFSAAQMLAGIRGRANIVFDLLFGVLTDDVELQEYGQNEQSSTSV